MKPVTGFLQQDSVVVPRPKDIGRISGKSKFGILLSKNKLYLSLIEACFLLEEKKMVVYQDDKRINWEELITTAAKSQEKFETNYLIYRDLRRRGHQLQLEKQSSLFTYHTRNQQESNQLLSHIATFSEREQCTLHFLIQLINQSKNQQTTCWLAIADEEGDITYYELSSIQILGIQKPTNYEQIVGLLLQDRVLLFNESITSRLHEQEFFGKEFGNGLQISLVEAFYLVKNNSLTLLNPAGKSIDEKTFEEQIKKNQEDIIQRYIVFSDLKKKGLIVKTGFKFGNHFRAYTKHPDKTHAEYLVHAVSEKETLGWAEVSRAIRLAHSVHKTFLFASINNEKNITYLSLKRIRP